MLYINGQILPLTSNQTKSIQNLQYIIIVPNKQSFSYNNKKVCFFFKKKLFIFSLKKKCTKSQEEISKTPKKFKLSIFVCLLSGIH